MCSWCIQDPIVRLVENWVWYMNNVSSVWQVIESSKRWWKCRNRFNQIGFVPFNILEPMAHTDSPVTSRPPNVRHKNTKTHTNHTSTEVCYRLNIPEFQCCLFSPLRIPAGFSPTAPRQDLLCTPTQPSRSTHLPLPAAPAQLTCIQPTYTSCGRHRK